MLRGSIIGVYAYSATRGQPQLPQGVPDTAQMPKSWGKAQLKPTSWAPGTPALKHPQQVRPLPTHSSGTSYPQAVSAGCHWDGVGWDRVRSMAALESIFQGCRELLSTEFDWKLPSSKHFTGKSNSEGSAALKVEILVPSSEVPHCGECDPTPRMGRD